jgi:PAS domain S-box-containing protein
MADVKPTYEELEQKVKNLEEQLIKNRKNEKSLIDTEKYYHLLFEYSPSGILISEPQMGIFLSFNTAICRQLGYSSDELTKPSIYDLFEMTPKEIQSRIKFIIKNGLSDFEAGKRTRHSQIRNVHITVKYTKLLNKPFIYSSWRDIPERKQAEQELVWETALLEAQLEMTIDGIIIVYINTHKILANERFF